MWQSERFEGLHVCCNPFVQAVLVLLPCMIICACLPACLSACPSACLLVCLPACLTVCLPHCLISALSLCLCLLSTAIVVCSRCFFYSVDNPQSQHLPTCYIFVIKVLLLLQTCFHTALHISQCTAPTCCACTSFMTSLLLLQCCGHRALPHLNSQPLHVVFAP